MVEHVELDALFNWINYKLTGNSIAANVSSLKDLDDAVILLELINTLTDNRFSKHLKISYQSSSELTRFQKLANVETLLNWLKNSMDSPFFDRSRNDSSLTVRGVGIDDIISCNEKLLAGFLWSIFWFYSLWPEDGIRDKRTELKNWIKDITGDDNITDFKSAINSKVLFKLASNYESSGISEDGDVQALLNQCENVIGIPNVLRCSDAFVQDDWSAFVYLSIWWEQFHGESYDESQAAAGTKLQDSPVKQSVRDLFGPSVLEKVSDHTKANYKLGLKLRVETFLVVVLEISRVKNTFLDRLEQLLLLVIEWLGRFSVIEQESVPKVAKSTQNTTTENIKTGSALSDVITKSIDNYLLIKSYIHEDKVKIYKELQSLRSLKGKLEDVLRLYGLSPFNEPNEKSLDKIERLYTLLKNSEKDILTKANQEIEDRISHLNRMFDSYQEDIESGIKMSENDVSILYKICNYENRIIRVREILSDLRELNTLNSQLTPIKEELQNINVKLGKVIDKTPYTSSIEENKLKLNFLKHILIDDLEFLKTQMIRKKDVVKVLRIAQKSEEMESKVLTNRERQGVHRSIHKLIQSSFNLQDTDAIHLIFNKYDTGSKGYLTKTEFRKAFGFVFPTMSEGEIDDVFEVVHSTNGNARRGINFRNFKTVLESGLDIDSSCNSPIGMGMSPVIDSSGMFNLQGEVKPLGESINGAQSEASESELINITSWFHLNSFKALSSDNKGAINENDFQKIILNDKLRKRMHDVFKQTDHGFDYADWFKSVQDSIIYQDNESNPNNDFKELKLENVLYDLERVDLEAL